MPLRRAPRWSARHPHCVTNSAVCVSVASISRSGCGRSPGSAPSWPNRARSRIAEMEETRERLHELARPRLETLAERRETHGTRERESSTGTRVAQGRERERALPRTERRALRVQRRIQPRRPRRRPSQSLTRAQAQQTQVQLQERRDELLEALEESVEPLAEQRERLRRTPGRNSVEVEQELNRGAQRHRESLEYRRARPGKRASAHWSSRFRPVSAGWMSLRLERQERLVRRQTHWSNSSSPRPTVCQPAVLESMESGDAGPEQGAGERDAVWQDELTKVGARIQRLGAINLAAIDEFREQSDSARPIWTRSMTTSARSLETLEQAIRKIDRETRQSVQRDL
jgi:chromosome segregation protein